jgi:hypothetical protein
LARIPFQVAAVLAGLPLIPILVTLLLLLLAPAIIPVPQLREAVKRAVAVVIGYLGDSYTLTMSPLQRDVITAAVERNIGWVAKRCKAVCVVAHSQGAALTHDALRRTHPPQVTRLVTLGSGIEKLFQLRLLFRKRRMLLRVQWGGVGASAILILSTFAGLNALTNREWKGAAWAFAVSAALTLVLGFTLWLATKQVDEAEYEKLLELPGAPNRFVWLNLYAGGAGVGHWTLSVPTPFGPFTFCIETLRSGQIVMRDS